MNSGTNESAVHSSPLTSLSGIRPLRVLVTDGDARAALAVVRSLGRAGHYVVAAERRPTSLAQASRYASSSLVYPSPSEDESGFVEALVQAVRAQRIEVLIPVADITTSLVARNRARFEPPCAVPVASAEAIRRAADKVDVIRTATRLGVPVPRTVFIEYVDRFRAAAHDLPYPVVIKPRRSRLRTPRGWVNASVSYADSAEALLRIIERHPEEAFPIILQERIEGPGLGVFMCYRHGKLIAEFSHRRLREKPPSGGVSVLCESIALDPAARAYACALLEALGWDGVAMVEFKVDNRDGRPNLMEINGRFWGSLQLAIDAGVDFPSLLVDTTGVERQVPVSSYRVGIKSRWLWGDIDSLISTLRSGTGQSRARAIAGFLKLWERDVHYENPRVADIKPWLYETSQRLRTLTAWGGGRW